VPTLLGNVTGSSSIAGAFGATSILIMVSVALETSRAIESQMMMRNYKGFLN
ncbi:MAG: preprotein translocase subunit SecY, partial [Lachnospiraceae bacterium]